MPTFLVIVFSTFLITLFVWVAVLFMFFKKEFLGKIVKFLVAFSAGTLMGGAFLHLMPEAAEKIDTNLLFIIFLISFAGFFLIEKLLFWRHCHKEDCPIHSFGYMNLVGDSIHNFIDGLIIAGAFMVNIHLGLATTLAIAAHEIPQEIGDFGVLIHAGFKYRLALIVNYLVALTVILGGVVGYFFFSSLDGFLPYILPVAAGGFVYIAASDLIPEIRGEKDVKKSVATYVIFILGILLMFIVKFLDH
ncbi:ZIP family metal transporter [Patescibacteria group bacterium]|nr:ZIP family metal transporter [Patescibacteria group bacterium]MBU1663728.1 ZIP family metal transporter [Patescibacteria group bacterium]MBU1934280.1 ZIP family metal transporter [Patescibacteria group bacterium]MBU2008151.1 ZIP family metal transporter [Patescibacteria group bacterium]MBU2233865.1 ZIP family metal transporter [Patescibacteria group bacterium]